MSWKTQDKWDGTDLSNYGIIMGKTRDSIMVYLFLSHPIVPGFSVEHK